MSDALKSGRKVELLAPAGNREAFFGAVHAGADAVYMGGEKFGARAYADNFSREELTACIRYGHIHGCRSYLTVNTLMKEEELAELVQELVPLYRAGLDGVIVQDIGALRTIRRHFPGMELHASTQMTVTGPKGALLLKELGVTRVVPARELSLRELTKLREESGLEVEAFVHGAMCYCYSGACLFSSLLGGRSGNRGRCAQPCRQTYETDVPGASVHRKEYYPLSLKDLCTIQHLPELLEGGVDSFKIEGRMKKPEYAAGVTALYRKYLDRCLAVSPGGSPGAFHVEEQDLRTLSGLYIRGQRQDGYLFRHNGREMVTLDSPSYAGSDESSLEDIRRRYIQEKKRIGIWMEADFFCGAPARIRMGTGELWAETTGAAVEPAQSRPVLEEDIRRQLQKLGETCFEAESIRIRTDGKGFYSLKEINALRREAARRLEDRIIESHGLSVAREPESAEDKGAFCEIADEVRSVEEKVGHPQGAGAEKRPDAKKTSIPVSGLRETSGTDVSVCRIHISTEEQLVCLSEYIGKYIGMEGEKGFGGRICDRIYVESRLLAKFLSRDSRRPAPQKALRALRDLRQAGIALWAALPYILRDGDQKIIEQALEWYSQGNIQGFLVRNLEEYGWLCRHNANAAGDQADAQGVDTAGDQADTQGVDTAGGRADTQGVDTAGDRAAIQTAEPRIQLDHTVYVWNSETAAFWLERDCGLTCPLELSGREWGGLRRSILSADPAAAIEKLIYGRIPMMVTANCIAKTAGTCLKGRDGRQEGQLTDRYRARFPVEICCDVCMNVIYNSVPLSLHRKPCLCREESPRLSFTVESGREMGQIIDFFAKVIQGEPGEPPYKDYTTGHEQKGVL